MNKEQGGGWLRATAEKGSGVLEKLHYALGALAIGAITVASPAEVPILTVIGAEQIAHGGLWTFIKNRFKKK